MSFGFCEFQNAKLSNSGKELICYLLSFSEKSLGKVIGL